MIPSALQFTIMFIRPSTCQTTTGRFVVRFIAILTGHRTHTLIRDAPQPFGRLSQSQRATGDVICWVLAHMIQTTPIYVPRTRSLYRYLFKPNNNNHKTVQINPLYLRDYYDTIQMLGYPNVCVNAIYMHLYRLRRGRPRTASHRADRMPARYICANFRNALPPGSRRRTEHTAHTCAHTHPAMWVSIFRFGDALYHDGDSIAPLRGAACRSVWNRAYRARIWCPFENQTQKYNHTITHSTHNAAQNARQPRAGI